MMQNVCQKYYELKIYYYTTTTTASPNVYMTKTFYLNVLTCLWQTVQGIFTICVKLLSNISDDNIQKYSRGPSKTS